MSENGKRAVDFTQLGLNSDELRTANNLLVRITTPYLLRAYLYGKGDPSFPIDRRLSRHFEHWLYDEISERPENFTSLRVLAHDEVQLNNYEADWQGWAKPTSPITADIAHAWEQFGSMFVVVGDGAQMILRPEELEDERIRKVSKAFLPDGRQIYAPDHLWSAFAQLFFEGTKMPIADNVSVLIRNFQEQEELNITTAQNTIEGHYITTNFNDFNLLLEKLFRDFNSNLNRFYGYSFGEYAANQGPLAQLPSGVMAVGILTPQNEFYCAWTGDVDIFYVDGNGLAYKKSFENVDIYDYVSRSLVGFARADRVFMRRIAEERIFEVGNLNGRSEVKIHFDHFSVPVGGGVILSTDGKRMQYIPGKGDFHYRRNIKSTSTDLSATLGWRDPQLHQLELMHQQRMWRKAVADKKVDPHEIYVIPDDALQLRLKRLK